MKTMNAYAVLGRERLWAIYFGVSGCLHCFHRKSPIPIHRLPDVDEGAPEFTLKETDYGFVYGTRRRMKTPDEYFWRVTLWMAPMYSLIVNGPGHVFSAAHDPGRP